MYRDSITSKNEIKKVIEVSISDISEKDFNPRKSGLLQENVEKLIKAEEFPPIHLGYLDDELIVVDGYHRLSATQRLGKDKIQAFITRFDSEAELKKQAFLSNVNHGIKLSELDIALNIYEFYILERKEDPTTTIAKVISDYNIPIRRGRQLFFWTVLNRVILENNCSEITELSKCEEYVKIISNRKEKYDSLSLVLKDEIRRFYNKYNHLVILELRQAVNLFLEGKDYLEEKMKKEEEKKIELEALKENLKEIAEKTFESPGEVYFENDKKEEEKEYIGTSMTIDLETGEVKEVKKITELTPVKDELMPQKQNNSLGVSNTLNKIGEDIMTIRRLQTLKRITFTEDDYLTLNSLMDRIEDIKSDIDTSGFFKHNEV
ncbi:ParB N-terminal domain-containing protein [Cetobacterium sp.]|uniref:ParB N-terminal domain-containing protein n=1 Tax=Cetobacterium sp. TaxID=2071632 RepID=UPI003F3C65F6